MTLWHSDITQITRLIVTGRPLVFRIPHSADIELMRWNVARSARRLRRLAVSSSLISSIEIRSRAMFLF